MATLQRGRVGQFQTHRHLFEAYKVKNVQLKHRHYSSSKLMKTMMNESKSQNFIEKNGCLDVLESAMQKRELKRYCINKFKTVKQQQKNSLNSLKRKNSSLKLFKRDDSQKNIIVSRADDIRSNQLLLSRKEDRVVSNGRETYSQQTLPIKRRFQIMRINKNNKLKLQIKDENLDKDVDKGDVSFEQTLEKHNFHQEQKIMSNDIIRSENVLGNGLRKSSSNKIKVLVKNPFERHIRQQQALQQQLNQAANSSQLAQFKQSQIIQKLDESSQSIDHQQQLQQLLAMI